jgi:holliday junction DNA helicase RuvB
MSQLSDQLAAEWYAVDPDARYICVGCFKEYPLASAFGPLLICPHCDAEPSDEDCRRGLKAIHHRRLKMQENASESPANTVVEQDEPRCDPPGLDDVIGNAAAVQQIRTAISAHCARGEKSSFPHILLAGVGGVGKTMLAEIIAREIKKPIRLAMGQTLNSAARVTEMLLSLKAGDVLFVDEMHGLKPGCQESLYRAMEDGVVVPVSKKVSAPIKLPSFTLIGATTDEWGLLPSLLQRFKYRIRMERMSAGDMASAISQRAERKGWKVTAEAAGMIANRSHGTPRIAIGLLDGAMDVALAGGTNNIDAKIVESTCQLWRLDGLGLDNTARKYLQYLSDADGPLRLNVVASKLEGLSRRTIETRVEPELVYLGLITKDSDGRRLTAAGKNHLREKP